jgi:cytochrome c-type biogenesis protein
LIKVLLLPVSAGSLALGVAVVGALLGEGSGTGGVNGFVESLSGTSSSELGKLGLLAPLGFAFAAGMVSAVNPCGFAMLPAYLGLYLGFGEDRREQTNPVENLGRALLVGGAVAGGFILLFGVVGFVIGVGARSIVDIIPWLGLGIGILLIIVGSWLLGGGELYTGLASRAASNISKPDQLGVPAYFLFGVSYGIVSLSCTLPIFLTVVGTSLVVTNIPTALGQLLLYAMGMGSVIMALTIGLAVFKGALLGTLQRTLRFIKPLSSVLMLVAGSYIVFYWLTIGELR